MSLEPPMKRPATVLVLVRVLLQELASTLVPPAASTSTSLYVELCFLPALSVTACDSERTWPRGGGGGGGLQGAVVSVPPTRNCTCGCRSVIHSVFCYPFIRRL